MSSSQKPIVYALLSALFLSLAWYWHLGFLIFFGFVPLLLLEDQIAGRKAEGKPIRFFAYSYLTFLLWNIFVTWWIVYASLGGACMAYFCNALLMALVFWAYSRFRRRIATSWAVWILIPLWLAFEHIHTLWDITWTWLSLGNVFAFHHQWVQWYEFTGVSGGSAWVLAVNILVFQIIKKNEVRRLWSKSIAQLALAILLPILISRLILIIEKPLTGHALEAVVVQPNIDPYNEKFDVSYTAQFKKMLALVRPQLTKKTAYVILPETFITGVNSALNEDELDQSIELQWFRDSLMNKFPRLRIITGGNSYRFFRENEPPTLTAHLDQSSGLYYDYYNTALFIHPFSAEVYHKSKLVPGVEKMPFPWLLKPLENLAINMGGTSGSLGTQDERTVFDDTERHVKIAPVICYESVYGDYVKEYVRKGASFICIITNDGWWENTPGYKQHLQYARLRAMENRRQIARSANTGTSCFIDEFGNITQATKWWTPAVIKGNIQTNEHLTFFTRWGDLISYVSVALSLLIILFHLFKVTTKKKIK